MSDDVNTPIDAYRQMADAWALPLALLGGTRAMRAASSAWLPPEPREAAEAYANRVNRSVLFNAFKRTVDILAAKPFAKMLIIGEESDPLVRDMAGDVDLEGTDLQAFAKSLLVDMLIFGKAHILVDFPVVDGQATREDEKVLKLRPYFARVSPGALIGWRAARLGGVQILEQLRIREQSVEFDGNFGERTVERVRVHEPGAVSLYRKGEKSGKFVLEASHEVTLEEIPLVTIYARRGGFLVAEPPLEDLAWLNLKHFQSQSDQDNILHAARVPILFAAGFSADAFDGTEIGPNRAIVSADAGATLSFVEHSGAAISAGREDLVATEDRMQVLGVELLVKRPRPGNQTATARAIDAAESISDLQSMVRGLESGLERAFAFAGKWLGRGDLRAAIDINQDIGLSLREASDLAELLKARQAGEITRRTYLEAIKRRGLLDADTDIEAEVAALATETPAMAAVDAETPAMAEDRQ